MSPDSILSLAASSVVSLSIGDAAAQLAEANTTYGLAKILWAQAELRLEPRACFIAGPDATITRHAPRWLAGFGYGGKLLWDFGRPAVVLDVKPNACGMLVGGLEAEPGGEALGARVQTLLAEPAEAHGVPIRWDFASGNHFIDVFAARPMAAGFRVPPCVFIVHSSCPEVREPTSLGPGLYYDRSPDLAAAARVLDTPWGPLHLLLDADAESYMAFQDTAFAFASAKRAVAAQRLFGEYEMIFDGYHQGLLAPGYMLLGCHHSLWAEPLPMTLRPDLPAYLVRGLPNVRQDLLGPGAVPGDASEYVRDAAAQADLVPHGGGYALEGMRSLRRHWAQGPVRFFEMERETGPVTDLITDPTELPMRYRGRQVMLRALEFGLCEPLACLDPIYVIKA